ncbi:MAG: porin family protein [Phycisphaerales bacterium]|jgi:opacity protein-like surface antigen|nr:porin family protein [Phycisphaerales bacterium]
MIKRLTTFVLCVTGVAMCDPTNLLPSTTLSFDFNGPVLNDSPDEEEKPMVPEVRIPLSEDREAGWYIIPKFGLNIIDNFNDANLKISYDSGYSYGVAVGKELDPGFRIQLDFSHTKNDLDSVFVELAGGVVVPVTDAKISQTPIILSAIWEPTGHDRFFPYFGLGVGGIKGKYSVSDLPMAFEDILDIGWAFALQAKVGFNYEITNSSSISVGYDFTHAHYHRDRDINNHTVHVGLQIKF